MFRERYRYAFTQATRFSDVRDTLHLALLAVEGLHGQARTRLDARFVTDAEKRSVVIDAGTRVGRHLNEIFTQYARLEFGEESFTVQRVERGDASVRHVPARPASIASGSLDR